MTALVGVASSACAHSKLKKGVLELSPEVPVPTAL